MLPEFHTLQHVRCPRGEHSIPQGKLIIGIAVIGVTLKHAIQADSDCAISQMSCSGELGISGTSSQISSDDALARIESDASKGLVVPSLTVVQSLVIISRSSVHHTVFFFEAIAPPQVLNVPSVSEFLFRMTMLCFARSHRESLSGPAFDRCRRTRVALVDVIDDLSGSAGRSGSEICRMQLASRSGKVGDQV